MEREGDGCKGGFDSGRGETRTSEGAHRRVRLDRGGARSGGASGVASRWSRSLASLLCLILAACLTAPNADLGDHGAAVASDTLKGTVRIVAVTYRDHRPDDLEYYVETDDGSVVRVNFAENVRIPQPDARVALFGRWAGGSAQGEPVFTATEIMEHHVAYLGEKSAGDGRRRARKHKVAVINLGNTKYTRQQLYDQINQTAGSAGSFLTENSGGVDSFEGDVFGPYPLDVAIPSTIEATGILARRIASSHGEDLTDYTDIAVLLPTTDAFTWLGRAAISNPGAPGQKYTFFNGEFPCDLVAHEIGHTLGAKHSNAISCGKELYTSNQAGCDSKEYGDPFDVMGDTGTCFGTHFSAPYKARLGWLGNCEEVTAGGSGVFLLSPLEASCGLRSLRIPVPGEVGNYYHIEYRKKGVGEFGGARGSDAVLISVAGFGDSTIDGVYRLDGKPKTNRFFDAGLERKKVYDLPGGIRIRVLELGEVAQVEVTMPPGAGAKCRNGEDAPADFSGRIVALCGVDGCPDDPNKSEPGICSCGVPDIDRDGDGVMDCDDECPNDPNKIARGACGCGITELMCARDFAPGLIRRHYRGSWLSLPNFDEQTPDAEKVVAAIDLIDYQGTDNFGLVFTGSIQLDASGTYGFKLESSDGARLRIDGQDVVVNNDGVYTVTTKEGRVWLRAGVHSIRIEYFEATGIEALNLTYRLENGPYTSISPANLIYPRSWLADQCPSDPYKAAPGACGCGWPEGTCTSNAPTLVPSKATFARGETVMIGFANAPGAFASIDIYARGLSGVQAFRSTGAQRSGSLSFAPLPAGAYEARLMVGNREKAEVAKATFTVAE